jgi:hypothetical protein
VPLYFLFLGFAAFPTPFSINYCLLALTLLVSRIGADHPHNTVATNDFAVSADFLY